MAVEKIVTNGIVRIVTCDWDRRCEMDLYYPDNDHKGFKITEKGKSDTSHKPGFYSIHSPLYGTDYSDEHAFEDRWSCECGRLIGKNYADSKKVCPHCGTPVEFVDIDMRITGWIVLERDFVIQPEYYKKIQSIIGQKNLTNILKLKDDREKIPTIKYDGIGMIEFREKFDEIMEYYVKKKSSKWEQYMFIMSHKDEVFVHCIPVYSSHLRPFVIRAEEIKYSDEDKLFKKIYSNSCLLNNRYELSRRLQLAEKRPDSERKKKTIEYLRKEGILLAIQTDLNTLWDLTFEVVKKKTGQIIDKILGGRLNYTARNVIIPAKHLRANEIELGYSTFLEMYKLEIISMLEKMYSLSPAESWSMWQRACVNFDESVYLAMEYIVKKGDAIVEINRNPTINYGSQLVVKVVHVKPDMKDFTMSLPESILRLLNADFDGDVLNIISIKITSMAKEYYKKLDPMRNIFISRNDGFYNAEAGIFKDQAIELYTMLNI